MNEIDRVDMAIHQAKVQVHRVLRWLDDRRAPVRRARIGRLLVDLPVVVEDRAPLWTAAGQDRREWVLELGKVENLRVAARHLDGLEFEAGQVFSFWAQVGPPVRVRGFVPGRELREGCVVPGVGGGLCLLSNALFAVATRAGFEVIERHAHSRRPPGSRAALGTDATVAWNYVDLRFVARQPWRLEVRLDAEALIVGVRTARRGPAVALVPEPGAPRQGLGQRRAQLHVTGPGAQGQASGAEPARWAGEAGASCMSCDQACTLARPRSRGTDDDAGLGRRSWLVDGVWPEYVRWLEGEARPSDRLLQPIDGALLRLPRYAWPSAVVGERLQFPALTVARAIRSRRLGHQGAARQRALLADERRLAAAMAMALDFRDSELVVAQNLLPHLAQHGALGGRRVTVLMQRLPLYMLQARLDQARAAWPDSPTLGDFRAEPALVEAEARALDDAAAVVTPHSEIAELFSDKATLLDWSVPATVRPAGKHRRSPGPLRLLLPASTVGRKGCWELRAALSELGRCELWIAGRELEGPGFWAGLSALTVHHGHPGLDHVDAVVLPAWVEHQPRALLRALAAGVPVIASQACGLGQGSGARIITTGDVTGLVEALVRLRAEIEAPVLDGSRLC
ncbi:VanW family protein [Haliangium sp.]|uniref:VanW family protein n=1 Tax=Haliangium sp. TaxID=2663208 RepID=UPI003D136FA0